MLNLELSDWAYLGGGVLLIITILVALKLSYSAKAFVPLPPTKPGFCLLPKYVVPVKLSGTDIETNLVSRLEQFGFREVRRDADTIVFSRGSALGDFSIKIAKLVATASLPLSNPAQLNVKYGVIFGCAFDTGDLWRFCRELIERIEGTFDHEKVERDEPATPSP